MMVEKNSSDFLISNLKLLARILIAARSKSENYDPPLKYVFFMTHSIMIIQISGIISY